MALEFPKVPDLPLARSPLVEVICQVRFPVILRIVEESPVGLQELIRKRFPILEEIPNAQFKIAGSSVGPSSEALIIPRQFKFLTADRRTAAMLASDSFSLSTTRYTIWSHFAADLELMFKSVNEIYELPFATRIGLRSRKRFE